MSDPDRAPSRSDLELEEWEPLPRWIRTPASPLRVRNLEGSPPQFRLVCVEHPEFVTEGVRSWIIRYAIYHASLHGVALPPRT